MTALEDLKRNFLKDGTNEIHWGKTVSALVVLLLLLAFVFYNNSRLNRKDKERLDNRRYTVGTTGKRFHNIKSSKPTVRFYYTVLGEKFEGNQDIDAEFEKTTVASGGRYFVEFSSKNPSNSKLLLGQPVPVTIIAAPDSGWIEIVGK